MEKLGALPAELRIWAVGERVRSRLEDAGAQVRGLFAVPTSVKAISPLFGQILVETQTLETSDDAAELHLFYNRPGSAAVYGPVGERLLPLDDDFRHNAAALGWPTGNLPETVSGGHRLLRALIREYLFVSLFRACAESLASENASRLAAMQRAEKNIDELLEELRGTFHRVRQNSIDEELFDVIAGSEALSQ
jgi:F-type H+-transporting ATPase subunit gamma